MVNAGRRAPVDEAMTTRTLTLLAVLTASGAFAQYHGAGPVMPAPAVVFGGQPTLPSCGPRPAPVRTQGQWELRTTQQWVAGGTQQVWVQGSCRAHPRQPWKQRCERGQYVTVQTAGHSETRQQWVWVDGFGGGRVYGRRSSFR